MLEEVKTMGSGSKVIACRLPADLAGEFEQYCEGAGVTSGEVLKKLVDDLLYPDKAQLDSSKQFYGVEATERIVELVNAQVKEQLEEQLGPAVDEHLELVQVDRALTEAEKEHYDETLASHGRELAVLGGKFARLKGEVDRIGTSEYFAELKKSLKE